MIALSPAPASADELVLAAGISNPPYFFLDEDRGIHLDLIRAVLHETGDTFKEIVYVSNHRANRMLQDAKADFAINVPPGNENFCYSDTILHYRNVGITLSERNLTINHIADLQKHRVTGFQNASKLLGLEFAQYASTATRYREVVYQAAQVEQLFRARTDVVISDKYIFQHFRNQNSSPEDKKKKITFHNIFPPTPRNVTFIDKKRCQRFNEGLKAIVKNGTYETIMKRYIDVFDDPQPAQ